jgi:hypothetical protein
LRDKFFDGAFHMITYPDYDALGRTSPQQAQKIWRDGVPIRYRARNMRDAVARIKSADLSEGRNKALSHLTSPLAQGHSVTLSADLLQNIHLEGDGDTPSVAAMMTGVELVGIALAVAGLALAIGVLVEGAMDDENDGGIVVNNGDGSVTINQGGGDGDGDGEEK